MNLARRTFFGMLWIGLGATLSATPMVVPGIAPEKYEQAAAAALTAKMNNPQRDLDELCFNPPYLAVLPELADPYQPEPDRTDYSGVLPSSPSTVDLGSLSPPPSSLALSGISLICAGLVRRRTKV